MGFSIEWENIYKSNQQLSSWPWSHMISLVYHYGNLNKEMKVLELGCGAGANIPFFVKAEVDYYAVDGSATMVERLNSKFKDRNVHIVQSDFTKGVPWRGPFDLVIDRGALVCNATEDIKHTIQWLEGALNQGGKFIGMDWFSTKYDAFEKEASEKVDNFTRVFHTGILKDMGKFHFSDEKHLKDMFSNFIFVYLAEKQVTTVCPKKMIDVRWDFVVTRG